MEKGAIAKFKLEPSNYLKGVYINSSDQRSTLTLTVAQHLQPYIWDLTDPNRLIIDIRPDTLIPKDILWTDGLQFQQRS